MLRAVLSPEIARAHLPDLESGGRPPDGGGFLTNIATNIWLFSGAFCLIGRAGDLAAGPLGGPAAVRARSGKRRSFPPAGAGGQAGHGGRTGRGHRPRDQQPPGGDRREGGSGAGPDWTPVSDRTCRRRSWRTTWTSCDRSVFRCTDITRQLLGFVRQADVNLAQCDVPTWSWTTCWTGLLGPELEVDDITVVAGLRPGPGPVVTDPGQLQQVILNLLKNAARRHRLGRAPSPSPPPPGRPLHPGGRGHRLRDDADQLEKVFMPFLHHQGCRARERAWV